MPSITYWSQLLPSPRSPSVAGSLAARVRDPAWLLGRQWQLGEFTGADAGSPAFTRITSHTARFGSAQLGTATTALTDSQLLEPVVEQEGFTPDLATRIEIGQSFEELLAGAGGSTAVRDQFRAAYPIAPAGATDEPATAQFLRVCAGRAIDGAALYTAARSAPDHVPARPALTGAALSAATQALGGFIAWVEATWGVVGNTEPAAWDATRLEYRVNVTANDAGGASVTLSGRPDAQAELDWYAFDLTGVAPPAPPGAATPSVSTSVIPGHVRFRGMPSARWWDFEGSKTDFGAIVPDSRDLAKLLFMDFLLLHGDDWYLAPLDVATGSLCWIDALTVTDVFGVQTAVSRADATQGTARWTMFSTADARTSGLAPFLVVPATATAALLAGPPVEEVHLLRDETADLAWAIEHTIEGPTGAPRDEPLPAPPGVPADAPAPLVYQLSTPVPASWFPLLPVTTAGGAVALVAGTVEGGPRAPTGRITQRLSAPGFQLPDEEVPRAGVRLQRVICRARSADGRTQLWIARRKQIGAGAASSGLRYDTAQPAR
jgi:hypothetical protein